MTDTYVGKLEDTEGHDFPLWNGKYVGMSAKCLTCDTTYMCEDSCCGYFCDCGDCFWCGLDCLKPPVLLRMCYSHSKRNGMKELNLKERQRFLCSQCGRRGSISFKSIGDGAGKGSASANLDEQKRVQFPHPLP